MLAKIASRLAALCQQVCSDPQAEMRRQDLEHLTRLTLSEEVTTFVQILAGHSGEVGVPAYPDTVKEQDNALLPNVSAVEMIETLVLLQAILVGGIPGLLDLPGLHGHLNSASVHLENDNKHIPIC